MTESHDVSHRDTTRESHTESRDPYQAIPSQAQLTTPSNSPTTPTTTTSTHAQNNDGLDQNDLCPACRQPCTRTRCSCPSPSACSRAIYRTKTEETERNSPPVVGVVARDQGRVDAVLADLVAGRSVGDPFHDLQALAGEVRRLRAALDEAQVELERTEGDLGVAVREAARARGALREVAALHVPECGAAADAGFCDACAIVEWPCATRRAVDAVLAPSVPVVSVGGTE